MATLTAIDWDRREARVMTAELRGRNLRIEQVFAVAWNADETDVAARAEALKNELRRRGVQRGEALVSISRSVVELKQLELPPAPDDDLPDLVRFQALRELHAVAEGAPLDFTTTPVEEGRPRSVLAAAVDAKYLADVRAVCEAAGLKVRRVLLRPCATASLVTRRFSAEGAPLRLTVDAGREDAEFVVTAGHDVVLLRAARLAGDHDSTDSIRALSSELRRTIAAVQYQLSGRRVESIALCGTHAEFGRTVDGLRQELDVPVEIVDPTELLKNYGYTAETSGESQRRLAPLAGGLLDEAEGIAPAFDFLHPRKRRPPPNRRKQFFIGGGIAAAVVLLSFLFVRGRLNALDAEIKQVREQSTSLEPAVKASQEIQRRADEIEKWLRTDVGWPLELARLTERMPPAEDVMLTQLRAGPHPQGGELQLTGLLAESSDGDALEANLRDERHTVEGRGRRHDPSSSRYPWRFQTSIIVRTHDAKPAGTKPSPATPTGVR